MSAAPSAGVEYSFKDEPLHVTLLELVEAVSDVTETDKEVVATVLHMLRSGRVRLCGSFRDTQLDVLC